MRLPEEPIPEPHLFPCGCLLDCKIIDGEKRVILSPCNRYCRIVALLIEVAGEHNRPVEFKTEL